MGSPGNYTPLGVPLPHCDYGRPDVRNYSRTQYLQNIVHGSDTVLKIVPASDRETGAKQRHVSGDGKVCPEYSVLLLQLHVRSQPHHAEIAQHAA